MRNQVLQQEKGKERAPSGAFLNSGDGDGYQRELASRHNQIVALTGGDMAGQLQYSIPRLQREASRANASPKLQQQRLPWCSGWLSTGAASWALPRSGGAPPQGKMQHVRC